MDLKGLRRIFLAGAAMSVLAGCGGGGGGEVFTFAPRPEPDPLAAPQPAANFNTTMEFLANYGLGMIGADAAYAKGAYGDGVIVAVIDSGIDTTHTDLDFNISAASVDIINPSLPITDDDGHGTLVAGVIAAEKNGTGTHGVAFNATILAIDADSGGGFTDPDLARAIEYATANLAHIINMSLGGAFPDTPVLRQWQINATQAGVILVSAAGNSGGSQPEYPAANAGDPQFNGLALAVGSVNAAGTDISTFSNRCGTSMNFCLVAPGEAIVTTRANAFGGGTESVEGTSFAAPHVSGAAALLIQAFPNLSPQDVVQILLQSADDRGTPGVDSVYGHGLLNLDTAVAPLGVLAVPLSGSAAGSSAALNNSRLSLGAPFGDALTGVGLLGEGIALDDFDRPYPVDLSALVTMPDRGFQLESRLAANDTQVISIPAPGLTLQMAMSEESDDAAWSFPARTGSAGDVDAVSLAGTLTADTGWHLGLGLSADGQFNPGSAVAATDTLFLAGDELNSPHYALLGSGDGVRLDQSLSDATTLSLGWFESSPVEAGNSDLSWGGGNMIQATLDHAFAEGGGLRVEIVQLDEADTFLGSQSGGAFGSGLGATSNFITVSGGLPVSSTVELVGSVTSGTTDVAGAGLLGEWGNVRSTAFGAGVIARDVFSSGDRFGFLAGQPLRVDQAEATLTVPVGLTVDEVVISESQRVDLSPGGREMNMQLAYDRGLWEGAEISSWLMMRTEPGHDADAPNDYGVGLLFRMTY